MQMSLGTLKICSQIGVLRNLAERKKQMLLIPAKRKELDKFVEDGAFVRWTWGSAKEHHKKLTDLWTRLKRELAKSQSPKVKVYVMNNIEMEITYLTKKQKEILLRNSPQKLQE